MALCFNGLKKDLLAMGFLKNVMYNLQIKIIVCDCKKLNWNNLFIYCFVSILICFKCVNKTRYDAT